MEEVKDLYIRVWVAYCQRSTFIDGLRIFATRKYGPHTIYFILPGDKACTYLSFSVLEESGQLTNERLFFGILEGKKVNERSMKRDMR